MLPGTSYLLRQVSVTCCLAMHMLRVHGQLTSCLVTCHFTLAGEFAQELQLLGPDYHVHECRAALQHLSASSLLGAAYVSTVRALLRLRCACRTARAQQCDSNQ
jgi:hypothetical protein